MDEAIKEILENALWEKSNKPPKELMRRRKIDGAVLELYPEFYSVHDRAIVDGKYYSICFCEDVPMYYEAYISYEDGVLYDSMGAPRELITKKENIRRIKFTLEQLDRNNP